MSHLRHRFLRLASAIAVVVVLSDWNPDSTFNLKAQAPGGASVAAANTAKTLNAKASPVAAVRVSSTYGKLPISFEVNQGQTDKSVQFLARSPGYTLFLTPGEAVLSLHSAPPKARRPRAPVQTKPLAAPLADTVRMQLIGANTKAEAAGVDPLPGKSNYFIGNDPARWHTDVPTFAKVRYSNVYPGIDLVYYGNQEGRLEHDFVVAPGADPNSIAIGLHSSETAVPDQNGDLTLRTKTGDLALRTPVAYQTIGGQRKTVAATYVLASDNEIRFQLGSYDRNALLVIDPVLVYTAVFGGTQDDQFSSITVDSSGNAYVSGGTYSIDFPLADPFQGAWSGPPTSAQSTAAFVSKINSSGTALLYSTYLGGPSSAGGPIVLDNAGRAYVAGYTGPGFPVKNAYQPVYGGNLDAFLTVLSPEGDSLVYSTYLGGSTMDYVNVLALDASENAYIAGRTNGGFPAFHSIQPQGTPGVFVAKFNSAGVLQYSSMYGNILGQCSGIVIDSSGSAYITGYTNAPDVPITKDAFRSTCESSTCGWVAKLSPSGDSLVYSTYLGSTGGGGGGIALDSSENVYVAGVTLEGFPTTKDAFQKTYGGGADGFVAKLNSSGTGLIWSTYLGGKSDDVIGSLALDQYRTVYVTGWTCSSNFPLMAPIQTYVGTEENPCQFFVTTLSGNLSSIAYYSTYFGTASASNGAIGIAVDRALNVYLGGYDTENVKSTSGALSTGTKENPGGGEDVFVSKLVIMDDLSLALSASSGSVAQGSNLTYTIAVTSKGPDYGYNVRLSDTLPAGTTFVSYDAGDGTCTAPEAGDTGTLNCELHQLNAGDSWDVTLTVNVDAAAGTTLSNTAATISNM